MSFYNCIINLIDSCTQQESSKRRFVFFANIYPQPSVGRGLFRPILKKTGFSTFLCSNTLKCRATSSSPDSLHSFETYKARLTQSFLPSFSNPFNKLLRMPSNLILGSTSLYSLNTFSDITPAMAEPPAQASPESIKSVTARAKRDLKSPILAATLKNKTVNIGLGKTPISGKPRAYKPKLIP